jgi:Tol biopolymer transport system component
MTLAFPGSRPGQSPVPSRRGYTLPHTVRRARRVAITLGIAALAITLIAPVAGAANAKTKRVSIKQGGGDANDGSRSPSVSANGRFVAFTSDATDLIGSDGNSKTDIFVFDHKKKKTKRVSIRQGGGDANDGSGAPSISADGRFVAFESVASDLIGNDGNSKTDIFVFDRKKKKTKRVSIRQGGGDANGGSIRPSISANGRFVAFNSDASDLIGADGNSDRDVFVFDRKTKKTKRVSLKQGGGDTNGDSFEPWISADGRFVAFYSRASDLIGNDGNSTTDVFVFDRKKKKIKRVSLKKGGGDANGESFRPSISADGRFVAFVSDASDLIGNDGNSKADIFVFDRNKKETKRVSIKQGGGDTNGDSFEPSISADGRFVAFYSDASDLIGNDGNSQTDIFVFDRKTKKTKRVSPKKGGGDANDDSYHPSTSADGRFVSFESVASDLIGDDGNLWIDIFRRGPLR